MQETPAPTALVSGSEPTWRPCPPLPGFPGAEAAAGREDRLTDWSVGLADAAHAPEPAEPFRKRRARAPGPGPAPQASPLSDRPRLLTSPLQAPPLSDGPGPPRPASQGPAPTPGPAPSPAQRAALSEDQPAAARAGAGPSGGRGCGPKSGPSGPRRPSPVCPVGRGRGAAMAEAAPHHPALPSGLLELCALLGAPRDSLRGPEQVRARRGHGAGGAGQRRQACAHGAPGVRGAGALRPGPARRPPPAAGVGAAAGRPPSRGGVASGGGLGAPARSPLSGRPLWRDPVQAHRGERAGDRARPSACFLSASAAWLLRLRTPIWARWRRGRAACTSEPSRTKSLSSVE